MSAVDKVISVAEGEVGYREKKTNSSLDDKTANAGSGNYTKYNRDLKAWAGVGALNAQWCQAFVDWCFIKAFGVEGAKKLLYTFTNYTPTGSDAFKKRGRYIKRGQGTPEPGDVVYFYSTSKGRIGHVGIVYKVSSSKVYTIEGNASDGVNKKSYNLTNSYVDGYGRVDYAALDSSDAPAQPDQPEELTPPYVEATGSVNVRRGPSTAYESIGTIRKGDRLRWFGFTHPENGWQLVEYEGGTAWVSGLYAKVVQ